MPLTLTAFNDGPICDGHVWTVNDVDTLALHIARVALGQSRHVRKIIDGYTGTLPKPPGDAIADATSLLTAPVKFPYHRDGWMFQVMSWIAACKAAPGGLIRPPHMIHAHKGFDGLQLEIDDLTQKVTAAIIFEDKATTIPRSTITAKVWPEIRQFEAGDRTNQLLAETVALLETRPNLDPDSAIESVIWADARRFRISITSSPKFRNSTGRKQLFAGYDAIATGAMSRRSGQVIEIANLRKWMRTLAAKSISLLPTI